MPESVAEGPDVGTMLPSLISVSVMPGSFLHGLGGLISLRFLNWSAGLLAARPRRDAQSHRDHRRGAHAYDDSSEPTSFHRPPWVDRSSLPDFVGRITITHAVPRGITPAKLRPTGGTKEARVDG